MVRIASALLWVALLACGGSNTYEVRGVVRGVETEYQQLMIEHEEIPGLMDAMTMNFDVADPSMLKGLGPGTPVEFTLEYTGKSYRILSISVAGPAAVESPGSPFAELLAKSDPAPDIELIDQNGEAFALADLRGKAVLLDFIFTNCPGPCPAQTGFQVELQRSLADRLGDQVWFVSVSLDPKRDTPQALTAYAERHGVDAANWSFLSGGPDQVAEILGAYGIGKQVEPGKEIEHTLVVFLIDPMGKIVERYMGLEHSAQDITRDLESTLRQHAAHSH